MIRVRLLLPAALVAGCAASGPLADPSLDRDLQVFQALLQIETCDAGRHGKYNVILDRPGSLQHMRIPDGWSSAQQARPRERWPHLELCAGARVVDAAFVAGIFQRETTRPRSWNGFYAAFPDAMGLFSISPAVFAPDGNAAIVHMDRTCDVLCGGGMLVELAKKNGRWQVVRREGTWIS